MTAIRGQSIDKLLESRSDLWRGRTRPAAAALGTGLAWLDRRLPAGGWPRSRISEFLPAGTGAGELELLLPMLARQTRAGLPVILAAPPLVPCPQALVAAGVDLAWLVVVRQADQALWAAEQGLKSALCGAVVAWPPPGRVQPRAIRRLQLAAEQGDAPAFVCYHPGQQPPPSLATLRLAIRPGPEVDVLRGSGSGGHEGLHPEPGNVVHFGRKSEIRSTKSETSP